MPEKLGRDSDKDRSNHQVLLQPFHTKLRNSWEAFYKMDKRDAIVGTNNGYCEGTSLDADMEISVETLSDAKLKEDLALNSAITTLHGTPNEPGSESEAVAKASELKSLKDKRVYNEI